jgi:hypothetical protein
VFLPSLTNLLAIKIKDLIMGKEVLIKDFVTLYLKLPDNQKECVSTLMRGVLKNSNDQMISSYVKMLEGGLSRKLNQEEWEEIEMRSGNSEEELLEFFNKFIKLKTAGNYGESQPEIKANE